MIDGKIPLRNFLLKSSSFFYFSLITGAGICYSRRNRMGMACVIRLSEPLLKLRPRKDLVETLLHEMIHAWNFIRGISEENGGHGKNFLAKMHEINQQGECSSTVSQFHNIIRYFLSAGTNISVYHTFRDEVDLYKKHWWRCDGACKNRQPFYGFVKRTCNRAPGPNDRWFPQHEKTCGGKFIKVKEPEKPEKKGKNKENKVKAPVAKKTKTSPGAAKKPPKDSPKAAKKTPKESPGADIRKFFKPEKDEIPVKTEKPSIPLPTTGGQTLGGKTDGRSRLLDMFAAKKTENKELKKRKLPEDSPSTSEPPIIIDDNFSSPYQSIHDTIKSELGDDDDEIIFIDDEFDDNLSQPPPKTEAPTATDMCHCPICNVAIKMEKVNEHLDQCLGVV